MKDIFTKQWIIANAMEVVGEYDAGILTIRGLHYRLVARGMTNDVNHYKKVVTSMIEARWSGLIAFETFSDNDRAMIGETASAITDLDSEIDRGKTQVRAWMNAYTKNRWENQIVYPEVFIEKKALQNVFEPICTRFDVALGACKGYPSLTFLNDAYRRFEEASSHGKKCVILYFGDYDPSGEDIPRSISENMERFGVEVDVKRIALMENQVIKWKLPPAPTKATDTRSASWEGLGQVELDAVMPNVLQDLCERAISDIFDNDLYEELKEQEETERESYISSLKQFVGTL